MIGIDDKTKKLRLSHKALLPKPEGWVEPERKPRAPRGDKERGDRGDRRPRRDNKSDF